MEAVIHHEVVGSGAPVILLHGFPMEHSVWNEFRRTLQQNNLVYTPDLPGLGKSELTKDEFTIHEVAQNMNSWVTQNKIKAAVLIGHSLGGYVALEMIKANPDMYAGLVLFHSTAFADNAEKKESRNKVLEFIDEHGVKAFTSNFIAPLFKDPQHPAIPFVKALSIAAGERGVKGYTQAMRDRADNSEVLEQFGKPILLLGGRHDKGITPDSLEQQARKGEHVKLHILEDAAHMGMFEAREEALTVLRDFLSKISAS